MFRRSEDDIAELNKRYQELAPKVAESRARRKLQRSRLMGHMAEMGRGICVQAMGTVLGAALIYLLSVAGGLLKGARPVEVIASTILVIGSVGPLMFAIIPLIFRRDEDKLLDIWFKLTTEEIRQKIAAGDPLTVEELKLIQAGVVNVELLIQRSQRKDPDTSSTS